MQPKESRRQNSDTQSVDGILSVEKSAELNTLQEIAASDALNFLDVRTPRDQFPLIAMATGIGKGRIIHKIIEKSVRKNSNAKILVIAGTKLTLVDQTQSALQGYLEDDGSEHDWVDSESDDELTEITEDVSEERLEQSFLYSTVDYKKRKDSKANVHVGTIQTIQSDSGKDNLNPKDYDLVIVDEAHNIGTQKRLDVIKQFKNVIGFTATPFRHTGVLKAPEQYGFTIINSLTLPEAQEREFLPPLIETPISTEHLIEEIPTNLNGEIDYKKLEKLLKDSPDLRPFIVDKIQEYIVDRENKKKTIIAVNFVWEAEEIAKLLKEKGISVGIAVNQQSARQIHSEGIPALDTIERYRLPIENPNSLQVLISPYVASEGFDAPLTEVLVWASPTDSSVRYTQFTGRLARRAPGKQYGHLIDFLYQTAQYKWSYNFGQWMKDTVVQLPDGRLFQGSRKQRATLENSLNLKKLQSTVPLEELLEDASTPLVGEGETIIRGSLLRSLFIGNPSTTRPIANEVLKQLSIDHPEMVVVRKNKSSIVTAVTDLDEFKRRMIEKGVELRREILEVQEGELIISSSSLSTYFIGSYATNSRIATLVIEELKKEHPEMVVERRNVKVIITAITDPEEFIRRMLEKGVELQREKTAVGEGELIVDTEFIHAQFIGDFVRLQPIVKKTLQELKQEHPEMVVERMRGTRHVIAITNLSEFRRRMVEKGVELQREIPGVQAGEFVVSEQSLRDTFIGGDKKIKSNTGVVLEELKQEHPEMIAERKNGTRIVIVITNPDEFKRRMINRGIVLKE